MKKILFASLMLGIGMVLILPSCKKNNFAVDKDIVPPGEAHFNVLKLADTAATLYVKSTGAVYKVPIGVTTVANTDRKINICYSSSTAQQGQNYTGATTVTIPAGKAVDTLTIQGLAAGYQSSTRVDTLKVSICGGDVTTSSYQKNLRLILRKYCDVVLSNLAGNYRAIDNGNYGPYPTTVVAGTTSGTTGIIQVTNLWDYGVPTVTTVNLDWTDPNNFTATIPDQEFVASDGVWIKGTTTVGSFSSCDQTFTLNYLLYDKATGGVYYNNQQTVLKR